MVKSRDTKAITQKTRGHVDHPSVVMKSKARILIDASDVLFKTVLTHRVAPSDATLIAFKILEVGFTPSCTHTALHYLHTRPINLHPDI